MARVGQYLRTIARLDAFESPAMVSWRIRFKAAAEQAVRERESRFPVLTAENAQEAIEWQGKRIDELMRKTTRSGD